ncbi:MAG: GntR family transcriptional regulator [Clostridiales bacterium]|nr:GntR family transcriptional regulator [Clostridiales bacterium]
MILKKNLNEQIYESLRQDIIDQKIKFGDKLANRDLQEKYNVSSTPVRDAINRLYQDGLIEDITNSGARVIDFNYKITTEINEIISLLSAQAVKLSAKKSKIEDIVPALEKNIQLQVENINKIEYFEYDKNFHLTFFEFCDNDRFIQMYKQYQTLWEILVKFYYLDKESKKMSAIRSHKEILSAYKQGDILLAQERLESHYLDAARPFKKIFGQ